MDNKEIKKLIKKLKSDVDKIDAFVDTKNEIDGDLTHLDTYSADSREDMAELFAQIMEEQRDSLAGTLKEMKRDMADLFEELLGDNLKAKSIITVDIAPSGLIDVKDFNAEDVEIIVSNQHDRNQCFDRKNRFVNADKFGVAGEVERNEDIREYNGINFKPHKNSIINESPAFRPCLNKAVSNAIKEIDTPYLNQYNFFRSFSEAMLAQKIDISEPITYNRETSELSFYINGDVNPTFLKTDKEFDRLLQKLEEKEVVESLSLQMFSSYYGKIAEEKIKEESGDISHDFVLIRPVFPDGQIYNEKMGRNPEYEGCVPVNLNDYGISVEDNFIKKEGWPDMNPADVCMMISEIEENPELGNLSSQELCEYFNEPEKPDKVKENTLSEEER